MSETLAELWERVRRELESARLRLSDPDDERLQPFHDLLGENELGLALDELVDIAACQEAPLDLWTTLESAAAKMRLDTHDDVHGRTVRRIVENIDRARDRRDLQRLLNEWDPIGVDPGAGGGPDDEYTCLVVPLLRRLRTGTPAADIAEFLRTELRDHFGLDPAYSGPDAFAGQLVGWYTPHRSA